MEYSNKQRKALFDRINSLSSTEHEEILKIVKASGTSFSQNKNGIFFNLSILPDEVVKEIDDFVSYCMSNKKELDEYDKIINECKMSNTIKMVPPVAIHTSLAGMAAHAAAVAKLPPQPSKDTWASLKVDEATMERFMRFVDRVNQEKERIGRKKANVKYNNAKKKYAKKAAERKFESEHSDTLLEEEYLVATRKST